MPRWVPVRRIARRLLTTPEAESDPSYRPLLHAQARRGMVLTAAMGLVGVVLFVGLHLLGGSRPVWIYGEQIEGVVSLADKTLIAAMCLALLALARSPKAEQWGRPLLAAVMVVAGLAMALDDVNRGDFSFTAAWLVLVLVVAIGTVPYTPRQALGLALGMLAIYAFVLGLSPEGLDRGLFEHRLAYFMLATVIVVSLSQYLYFARYAEHQARRRAEGLHAQLSARTEELERSLKSLGAAQAQLVRNEKLAALGQLTAGIAHEIQNPLNFVTGFAELNRDLVGELRETLDESRERPVAEALPLLEDTLADLDGNAAVIDEHGQRAARIVKRMMEHAQAGPGETAPADLNRFVEEQIGVGLGRLRSRAGEDAVEALSLERDYAEDAGAVALDHREMGAVLLNLLDNAFRAARSPGLGRPPRVRVATRCLEHGVEIAVTDNGPGIPETSRGRLFEPFFTTRPTGEGTGLGLSLAHDAVVHGHGGTLTYETVEGEGTTFTVRLPA